MENQQIAIFVLILLGLYFCLQNRNNIKEGMEEEQEGFKSYQPYQPNIAKDINRHNKQSCSRGYCPEDKEKSAELRSETNTKYPCIKKYAQMGYDNPYIYPYNYNWNKNGEAVNQAKYPQWVQFLSKELLQDDQFPGY